MNFIKNPMTTIANSAEINRLKDKRKVLQEELNQVSLLSSQYDEQIILKTEIDNAMTANTIILSTLGTIFTKNNIKFDIEYDEFISNNQDKNIIAYKNLYDKIILSNKSIDEMIKHIEKNLQVKKEIYEDKKTELTNKINNI